MHLHVFVYGTLKRGYWNHDRCMKSFVSVEPATIVGRIHLRHTRTPILEIPPPHVLAFGTTDCSADLRTQERLAVRAAISVHADERWLNVHGELYAFDDAATRVPLLDELEEYVPGADSLYDRVLAPVSSASARAAWVYVVPARHTAADYAAAKDPSNWDGKVEGHPRALA